MRHLRLSPSKGKTFVRRNELSNRPLPKAYTVIEHLMVLKTEERRWFERGLFAPREVWETNYHALKWVWDVFWRRQLFDIELVTFESEKFAEEMTVRFDSMDVPGLPVNFWLDWEFQKFVDMVPTAYVWHAIPDHRFRYGAKGLYVGDPEKFSMFL